MIIFIINYRKLRNCLQIIVLYNKRMIFYINNFSLIMFYHSVWLGFELFLLRIQAFRQLVQFTLVRKIYDNHHCHNNPPDRKWVWSLYDVMPGRDGPENSRILKKSQLKVDIGPRRQIVEFLLLGYRVEIWGFGHWVEELSFSDFYRQRWIEILNTTRCAERWGWGLA